MLLLQENDISQIHLLIHLILILYILPLMENNIYLLHLFYLNEFHLHILSHQEILLYILLFLLFLEIEFLFLINHSLLAHNILMNSKKLLFLFQLKFHKKVRCFFLLLIFLEHLFLEELLLIYDNLNI